MRLAALPRALCAAGEVASAGLVGVRNNDAPPLNTLPLTLAAWRSSLFG